MNITDPIRRHAMLNPDSIAVVRPDGANVSYGEFDRMIDSLATRALDLGLVPGNIAGLNISGAYKFPVFALALALARLGIGSAPMSLPANHMDVCFAQGGIAGNDSLKVVTLDPTWAEIPPSAADIRPVPSHQDGAAICRIFSSSGTIGIPKHVAISHDMMARRIYIRWLAMGLPSGARQVCEIGLATHWGFNSLLRVLWLGGMLVITTNPEQIASAIQRYRVNCLVIPPITLEHVIASLPQGVGPFPSLETIEVGGSLLPKRLYDLAQRRLCANIVSVYGSTETAVVATAPMPALDDHPGAVGYVLPGVEVQAVDDDDRPLPPGTEGILRVRSDTCVKAYIDDAVASASVFKGGWFYPGDVGAVSRDGRLTVAGRTNEFINSGGTKVSPQRIEEALLSFAGVRDAAAFGVPDAVGLTQIWAAIVPDGPLNAPALEAFCGQRLRENAPKFILQLRALPRNDAGKVLRDKLIKMATAASQKMASSTDNIQ